MLTDFAKIWWLVCNLTPECWCRISLKYDVVCQRYGNVYIVIVFSWTRCICTLNRTYCRLITSSTNVNCDLWPESVCVWDVSTETADIATDLLNRQVIGLHKKGAPTIQEWSWWFVYSYCCWRDWLERFKNLPFWNWVLNGETVSILWWLIVRDSRNSGMILIYCISSIIFSCNSIWNVEILMTACQLP